MPGFRPIRHITGGAGGCFKTRTFQKDGTAIRNNEIHPGDPVILLGTGLVRGLGFMSAATTPAQRAVVGVVARIVENRQGKPKTFATSGKDVYSSTAETSDWIEVYTDPGVVYEATLVDGAGAAVSAGQTDLGRLVQATAVAANIVSAAGQSGYHIQASAPATVNAGLFRIIDISPRTLTPTTDKGSSTGLVEVVFNQHLFGNFDPVTSI